MEHPIQPPATSKRPNLDPYAVDHQRVAFVMADGIPIPGWRHARRMRLVHTHVADFVIVGIEDRDLVRLLEHLHPDIPQNEGHPSGPADMYGTPHSPALHVVERYRLLDYEAAKEAEERGQREIWRIQGSDPGFARNPDYRGKGLQLEFTVEDDGVFTQPWSAAISYRRPLGEWPEMVCADTTHEFLVRDLRLPTADKPDF
jgi:hypothetical protein